MAEVGPQVYDDDEINLLDYWRVIWKYKWFIGGLCSVSVIAAFVFSLLSPKIYESTATMLVPKEGGGGNLLSALAASGLGQQISGVSIPSLTPNRDLLTSLLKSRLMAKEVVEQFKLKERYEFRTLDEAIDAAKKIPQISQTKEGVIEIKVEDTDPVVAADIANFYIEQLDRFVTQFGTSAASRQRRFIAEQLARAGKGLKSDEETLREFQEKNRAVLLGDMANSMKLPGAQVPKIGMELGRLTRDLKVQEAVYTLLTQQLEQAKIAEAQDVPVVQVLDRAVPALRKSKPIIRLNMALAGAVSLFVGIFLAFFLEYVPRYIQRQRSLTTPNHP